jgi:hypothetical protein
MILSYIDVLTASGVYWLQIQRYEVLFPTLPDFLRGSGTGTGPTQPRPDN